MTIMSITTTTDVAAIQGPAHLRLFRSRDFPWVPGILDHSDDRTRRCVRGFSCPTQPRGRVIRRAVQAAIQDGGC